MDDMMTFTYVLPSIEKTSNKIKKTRLWVGSIMNHLRQIKVVAHMDAFIHIQSCRPKSGRLGLM